MRSRRGILSIPSICLTLLEKRAACVSSMVEYWGHDIIILLWLAPDEVGFGRPFVAGWILDMLVHFRGCDAQIEASEYSLEVVGLTILLCASL